LAGKFGGKIWRENLAGKFGGIKIKNLKSYFLKVEERKFGGVEGDRLFGETFHLERIFMFS
jgi:hypothetical protein